MVSTSDHQLLGLSPPQENLQASPDRHLGYLLSKGIHTTPLEIEYKW